MIMMIKSAWWARPKVMHRLQHMRLFMHHCSSNNSRGHSLFPTIIRGRRLFQILLTGSRALNILFYYPIKSKKYNIK